MTIHQCCPQEVFKNTGSWAHYNPLRTAALGWATGLGTGTGTFQTKETCPAEPERGWAGLVWKQTGMENSNVIRFADALKCLVREQGSQARTGRRRCSERFARWKDHSCCHVRRDCRAARGKGGARHYVTAKSHISLCPRWCLQWLVYINSQVPGHTGGFVAEPGLEPAAQAPVCSEAPQALPPHRWSPWGYGGGLGGGLGGGEKGTN